MVCSCHCWSAFFFFFFWILNWISKFNRNTMNRWKPPILLLILWMSQLTNYEHLKKRINRNDIGSNFQLFCSTILSFRLDSLYSRICSFLAILFSGAPSSIEEKNVYESNNKYNELVFLSPSLFRLAGKQRENLFQLAFQLCQSTFFYVSVRCECFLCLHVFYHVLMNHLVIWCWYIIWCVVCSLSHFVSFLCFRCSVPSERLKCVVFENYARNIFSTTTQNIFITLRDFFRFFFVCGCKRFFARYSAESSKMFMSALSLFRCMNSTFVFFLATKTAR